MKELKPKLIIAGSNKKKRGSGYLLTLILVFAVGVYVGMKVEDTEFSGDQLIGNSQDHSQTSQSAANKGPEVIEEVANIREGDSENEIHNVSSAPGTITKSDIGEPSTADSHLDGRQLQDITTSESSETKVTLMSELSHTAEPGSEGSGLPEIEIYRLYRLQLLKISMMPMKQSANSRIKGTMPILFKPQIQEKRIGTSLRLVSLKQPERHGISQRFIKAKRAGMCLLKVYKEVGSIMSLWNRIIPKNDIQRARQALFLLACA